MRSTRAIASATRFQRALAAAAARQQDLGSSGDHCGNATSTFSSRVGPETSRPLSPRTVDPQPRDRCAMKRTPSFEPTAKGSGAHSERDDGAICAERARASSERHARQLHSPLSCWYTSNRRAAATTGKCASMTEQGRLAAGDRHAIELLRLGVSDEKTKCARPVFPRCFRGSARAGASRAAPRRRRPP
jgi:hypothetical protein